MSLENSMKLIKRIHPDSVILVKIGKFYQCFDKDAYIVSDIFEYKLKKDKYISCGFPLSSLNKVMVGLEKRNVSYVVVDKRNEYEVTAREEFGNKNSYYEKYKMAKLKEKITKRVEKLDRFVFEKILNGDKEVINKVKAMEKLYGETRKV